jgi:hypothetical protein
VSNTTTTRSPEYLAQRVAELEAAVDRCLASVQYWSERYDALHRRMQQASDLHDLSNRTRRALFANEIYLRSQLDALSDDEVLRLERIGRHALADIRAWREWQRHGMEDDE